MVVVLGFVGGCYCRRVRDDDVIVQTWTWRTDARRSISSLRDGVTAGRGRTPPCVMESLQQDQASEKLVALATVSGELASQLLDTAMRHWRMCEPFQQLGGPNCPYCAVAFFSVLREVSVWSARKLTP